MSAVELSMLCYFAEKAWLFKSHLMPAKLTFRTLDDQEYVVSDKLVVTLNRTMYYWSALLEKLLT